MNAFSQLRYAFDDRPWGCHWRTAGPGKHPGGDDFEFDLQRADW